MLRAVQQRRQDAQRQVLRLGLLLRDGGQPLAADALDVLGLERRVAHDVGKQRQRRRQLVVERVERGGAAVQLARHAGDRAQALAALRHFHRIQAAGALVHQRGGEVGGAELAALVGRVAGVEQQFDLGHRDGVAFGQHHFDAVLELAALQLREAQARKLAGLRDAGGAVDLVLADAVAGLGQQLGCGLAGGHGQRLDRLVLGRRVEAVAGRQHGQQVVALAEPGVGGLAHAGHSGGLGALQVVLVGARIVAVDLALGQDRGLAGEAADLLQAAHEAGAGRDLRALQFVGARAFGQEFLQLVGDGGLDLGRVRAVPHVGDDLQLAGQRERLDAGRDIVHQVVAVHQALVQAAGLAAAEHVAGQVQLHRVVAAQLRRHPGAVDARLRDMVVLHAAGLPGQRGDPRLLARHRLAGGDVAEVLRGLGLGLGHGDVAGQHQGGVGGAVVVVEPLLDVVQRRRVEVGHRADGRVLVRMVGREDVGQDVLVHAPVGGVLALALLVLHHAALRIQFLLPDRAEQVAHAVRFHPQRQVQGGGRHGLEVVGAVGPGGAVHVVSADFLERLEIAALVVFRAGEHQVFEQVGEAGLAGRLVAGADVVPDAHRHHRRLVVLVHHHGQAVGQGEAGVGDLRHGGLGGQHRQRGAGWGDGGTDAKGEDAGDQQRQGSEHGPCLMRMIEQHSGRVPDPEGDLWQGTDAWPRGLCRAADAVAAAAEEKPVVRCPMCRAGRIRARNDRHPRRRSWCWPETRPAAP